MGILFKSSSDGDWESTSGKGKNKVTQGQRGGWDYQTSRNFGSGPKPEGGWCAVVLLAGLASGASVVPVLADLAGVV